jgi:hypothetical protein
MKHGKEMKKFLVEQRKREKHARKAIRRVRARPGADRVSATVHLTPEGGLDSL